jgi:hypothetical protein
MYKAADAIIRQWVVEQGLHLYTQHGEAEIRVVRMNDRLGRTYGIGIEPPDDKDLLVVRYNAWDFRNRSKTIQVSIGELRKALDSALLQVRQWMDE